MRAMPAPDSPTRTRAALVILTAVLATVAMTLMPVSTSYATNVRAPSKCKIVIRGAHWSLRLIGGRFSGSRYTVSAQNYPCSTARQWAVKFTHEKIKGAGQQGLGQHLNGPAGFDCRSGSEAVSGDKLVYTGYCHGRGADNVPSFAWAPKP